MTQIYNFHPLTREFLGRSFADESPLEPGVSLIPANATTLEPPPIAQHQVAVFQNGAWSLTPDYRGVTYWLDDVAVMIEEVGISPPGGSTPERRPRALSAVKAALMVQVDDAIGSIYGRFIRFEAEYNQRETAARAFRAGGYAGDAGIWVMGFADPAGLTAQVAADLIISQADNLRVALQALGAQRMRKYGISAVADAAAAQALHDDIVAQALLIAAGL